MQFLRVRRCERSVRESVPNKLGVMKVRGDTKLSLFDLICISLYTTAIHLNTTSQVKDHTHGLPQRLSCDIPTFKPTGFCQRRWCFQVANFDTKSIQDPTKTIKSPKNISGTRKTASNIFKPPFLTLIYVLHVFFLKEVTRSALANSKTSKHWLSDWTVFHVCWLLSDWTVFHVVVSHLTFPLMVSFKGQIICNGDD